MNKSIGLQFKIEKAVIEIKNKYDVVVFKVRFDSYLGEEKFYMDSKTLRNLLKNKSFSDYVCEEVLKEFDCNYTKIEDNYRQLNETFCSPNRININPISTGFNCLIEISVLDKLKIQEKFLEEINRF